MIDFKTLRLNIVITSISYPNIKVNAVETGEIESPCKRKPQGSLHT